MADFQGPQQRQTGRKPAGSQAPNSDQLLNLKLEAEAVALDLTNKHQIAVEVLREVSGSSLQPDSKERFSAVQSVEAELKLINNLEGALGSTLQNGAIGKSLIAYKTSVESRLGRLKSQEVLSANDALEIVRISRDPNAINFARLFFDEQGRANKATLASLFKDPVRKAKTEPLLAALPFKMGEADGSPSVSPPPAATTQIVDEKSAKRIEIYASAAKDALSNKSSTIAPAIRGLAEEQYKIIEKVAKALSDKKLNVDVVAPDFVKLKEGLNQLKDDSSSSPADLERSYNKLKTLASKAFKDDGAVALAIGTGEAALVRGLFKEISGAPASGVVNAGKEETPVPGTVRPKPQGQQNYRYNPQTTAQLQAAKEASGIFYAASEDLAMKFLLESGEYTTTLSKRTFKISPADSVEEVYKVIQDILSQEMFDSLLMAKGLARIDKKGNFSTPDEIGRASSYKNQVQRLIVLSRAYGAEVTSYARNGKFVEKMREAASGKDPTTLLKDSMFMAQVKALGATLADGLSFAAAVRADESGDKNLAQNASSAAISRLQQIINKNIPRGGLFGGFWGGFFGGGAGFYTPGIFNTGFMIRF
jgi:hypothetical protein